VDVCYIICLELTYNINDHKEESSEKDISASSQAAAEHTWLQEEDEHKGRTGNNKQEKGKGEEEDFRVLSQREVGRE
jgi:hypothetical protein